MTTKKPMPPIPVEELGEARWERIERRVLDARAEERAEAPARPGRRLLPWVFAGGLAAVAAMVVVLVGLRRQPPPPAPAPTALAPTRIVTPPGAPTRVQVGDAVVLVNGDSELEITQDSRGGVSVALARGLVDCEVAPREQRPPFLVVAGDVTVTVVGTKFQVEKAEAVKVTVTRGKVSVRSPSGERPVAAGESWASGEIVAAAPAPGEPRSGSGPGSRPDPVPPPPPAPPGPSADQSLLDRAESLDKTDPPKALELYRKLLGSRDRTIAARSLYSIAYLEYRAMHYAEAIDAAEKYLARHPRGKNARDAFEIRVESYLARFDLDEPTREVAREYLRRWPDSKYAERARRIANW